MYGEARFEAIINRLRDLEIYFKEFMQVDLSKTTAKATHRLEVVNLDTSGEEVERETMQWQREILQCDHKDCHRVRCRFKNTND